MFNFVLVKMGETKRNKVLKVTQFCCFNYLLVSKVNWFTSIPVATCSIVSKSSFLLTWRTTFIPNIYQRSIGNLKVTLPCCQPALWTATRRDHEQYDQVRSGQVRVFNVHIQSKLLYRTPVTGTGIGLRRFICPGQENILPEDLFAVFLRFCVVSVKRICCPCPQVTQLHTSHQAPWWTGRVIRSKARRCYRITTVYVGLQKKIWHDLVIWFDYLNHFANFKMVFMYGKNI